jgi:hypothetical protein
MNPILLFSDHFDAVVDANVATELSSGTPSCFSCQR